MGDGDSIDALPLMPELNMRLFAKKKARGSQEVEMRTGLKKKHSMTSFRRRMCIENNPVMRGLLGWGTRHLSRLFESSSHL